MTATGARTLGRKKRRCGQVWLAVALASSVLLSATPPAWAFDESIKSEAMLHYKAGKDAYERHQYLKAADEFHLALAVLPLPVLALWAARSDALSGDLIASQAAYLKAIRLTPNELWVGEKQQRAQVDAARELEPLSKRIARLRLTLPTNLGSNGQLFLDQAALVPGPSPLEIAVNPGSHVVALKYPDGIVERRVTLAEGQVRDVLLEMRSTQNEARLLAEHPERAQARAEPSSWRTVGWVSLSVGGAALALGSVTGLILWQRHNDLEPDCPRGTCDPTTINNAQVEEHNELRLASSIGFVTGTVFGAVGLTLLLTTPAHESTPEVALRFTPTGPRLEGAF